MDAEFIEEKARELQLELWREREALWPGRQVLPIDVLDVSAAAHVLELEYLELPDLGGSTFAFRGQKFRVAGLMDRQARKMAVSTAFAPDTVRFTGAHELGHWILHPQQVLHRDRALDGSGTSSGPRDPVEREADYFAACFLMPARLLDVLGRSINPLAC